MSCSRASRAIPLKKSDSIRYWNENVHDLKISTQPRGTRGFFDELELYRFAKTSYLLSILDDPSRRGQKLLEIGCGAGVDLVRLAKAGAHVTGIDLSPVAVDLARRNFSLRDLPGKLQVMDGEEIEFEDDSFDVVYGHSVLQYTSHPSRMVSEIRRVLRPGGEAILAVYHRNSWLGVISRYTGVALEHSNAPFFRLYTWSEFRHLLAAFPTLRISTERFPVKTRLHHGWKGRLYNLGFVPAFNLIPKRLVVNYGFHLVAFAK